MERKAHTYLGLILRFAMVEDVLDHIVAILVLQQLLSVRVDLLQDPCTAVHNKPCSKTRRFFKVQISRFSRKCANFHFVIFVNEVINESFRIL